QRVWDGAPEAVQAFMAGAIDTYYRGKPQVQRDEAMRSCGLLAQTLMLVARGQGLDSCPMDGFDFDAVARLINLPDNHVIGLMVAVGKKAVEPWPRSGKLPREELVIRDRF
ncbi:nitroreductase family protein, partial [Pseudomonas aeruginosa]